MCFACHFQLYIENFKQELLINLLFLVYRFNQNKFYLYFHSALRPLSICFFSAFQNRSIFIKLHCKFLSIEEKELSFGIHCSWATSFYWYLLWFLAAINCISFPIWSRIFTKWKELQLVTAIFTEFFLKEISRSVGEVLKLVEIKSMTLYLLRGWQSLWKIIGGNTKRKQNKMKMYSKN